MGRIVHSQYIRNDDPVMFCKEVEKAIDSMQRRGLVVDPINVSMTHARGEDGFFKIFQATFLTGRIADD